MEKSAQGYSFAHVLESWLVFLRDTTGDQVKKLVCACVIGCVHENVLSKQ